MSKLGVAGQSGRKLAFAVALSLAALGCSNAPSHAEQGKSLEQPIAGSDVSEDRAGESPLTRPVGKLSLPPDSMCSGTVITPRHVLTAAHCVCIKGEERNAEFGPVANPSQVSFKFLDEQNGGAFVSKASFVWVHPQAKSACEDPDYDGMPYEIAPHDLAVIELEDDVPPSKSGPLPKLSFKSPQGEWDAGVFLKYHHFLVGWGATDAVHADGKEKKTGVGIRRIGEGRGLRPAVDSCDFLEVSPCHEAYQWEAPDPEAAEANHRPGDSGGPLYLESATTDDFYLVGVASQFQWFTLAENVDTWAPTGDGGEDSNAKFILHAAGGDADGDFIPDAADNCPGSLCVARGKEPSACNNPDQADDDGDGIGEACDNCPQRLCDDAPTSAASYYCKNALQENHDGDGYGDACDLCPEAGFDDGEIGQVARQARIDQDQDGIGDLCDYCPDRPNTRTACVVDNQCPDSICGESSFGGEPHPATGQPMGVIGGYCARPVNDTCRCGVGTQNSNVLVEDRQHRRDSSVEELADACDPVPLIRLGEQLRQEAEISSLTLGDNEGPDDVHPIPAEAWVSAQGATIQSSSGSATFRFCGCVDPQTSTELSLEECVGRGLKCDWDAPHNNPAVWRPITERSQNPASAFSFRAGESRDVSRNWSWRSDVTAGRIAGSCSGTTCSTFGALFARAGSTQTFSPRDSARTLRETFQLYRLPLIEFNTPYLPPSVNECIAGRCRWFNPRLWLPDDFRNRSQLPWISYEPIIGIVRDDKIWGLRNGATDLAPLLSAGAVRAFGDLNLQLLQPVEAGYRVRAATAGLLDRSVWAAVPLTLAAITTPIVAKSNNSGKIVTLAEADAPNTRCATFNVDGRATVDEAGQVVSLPGERTLGSERKFLLPASLQVVSGTAVPGGAVEFYFSLLTSSLAGTCYYRESNGSYLFEECDFNVAPGQPFPAGFLRVSLLDVDASSAALRVRATLPEQEPCQGPSPTTDPKFAADESSSSANRLTTLAAAATGPAQRTDFKSVFSAIEDALYVVGGRDESGQATHGIWKWNVNTSSWRVFAPNSALAPSANVLSVAYDQPHGRLYVLDVDVLNLDRVNVAESTLGEGVARALRGLRVRPKELKLARLYRYDVGSGESKLLAAWPYLGKNERVSLSAMDDGKLALVTAKGQAFSVYRLDVARDRLTYAGALHGSGTVLGEPAMGDHQLVLPVLRLGKLTYDSLEPGAFRSPGKCDDL